MNNLILDLDGVTISVQANSERELFDVMRKHGLITNIAEQYYFSRSQNKWYLIEDMPEPFLLNALAARMRDVIDEVRHSTDDISNILNAFDAILIDVDYNIVNPSMNLEQLQKVVRGLLRELWDRVNDVPVPTDDSKLPF